MTSEMWRRLSRWAQGGAEVHSQKNKNVIFKHEPLKLRHTRSPINVHQNKSLNKKLHTECESMFMVPPA